jgi:hypothetical protein
MKKLIIPLFFLVVLAFGVSAKPNVFTDLSSTDTGNWIGTNNLYSVQVVNNESVYIGGLNGRFGRYNASSNILTDLSATDTGNWIGNSPIYSLALENSTESIYFQPRYIGRYNLSSNISSSLLDLGEGSFEISIENSTESIYTRTYNAINGSGFGRYNASSNTVKYLLKLNGVLTTAYTINKLVYIGAVGGQFYVYNITSGIATDLSGTDTGDWLGTKSITNIKYANNESIYLVAESGRFGRYNASSNILTDLSATDTGNWIGTINSLHALLIENSTESIYVGGDGGKFGRYNYTSNILTDLTSTDTGNWIGTSSTIYDFSLHDNTIYAAIGNGKFGAFNFPINFIPVISAVTIIPSIPEYNDTLTFTNTTTDADDDSLIYSIKWYINGTRQPSLDNQSSVSSGLNYGETYIVNLKAYDGTSWSSARNSTQVTINDLTNPVYLSGSPSSGTSGTQFTLSLQWYDWLNITSATISMKDPDNIVVFDDESMSYSTSKLNLNGTRNNTYIRTYTPTKTGTYTILNSTATDKEGNKLIRDIGTHTIVVSAPVIIIPPSGGGGGAQPQVPIKRNFTLTPNIVFFTVAPSSDRTMEFTLSNEELTDIRVHLTILSAGDQSDTWAKFQDGTSDTFVNVTASKGLQSNKRIVRYTVKVPSDAIEQDYNFLITAKTESTTLNYNATMTVGQSFWTWFNNDLWSTEYEYCADDAFNTTSTECQNPKFLTLGFGIREIVILIIAGIVIMLYFDFKATKGRRR